MDNRITAWVNAITFTKSAQTVAGYAWEVRAWARTTGFTEAGQVTRADLEAYLADRRRGGVSAAAIKRAVAAFKSFFGHTLGDGSPAAGLPFPKVHKRKQRTLRREAAGRVLAACDTSSARGVRDLALLCVMLDSGVRAAEVCRLRVADLDLESGAFRVVVKGGDEAQGIVSAPTVQYVSRWLSVREQAARPGVQTLFVGLGGKKPGTPLTTGGLRAIFRQIGKRAGLAAFSPHDLRRSMAVQMHLLGAPSRMVQLAGRWEDIRQMERYTEDLAPEDVRPFLPVSALLAPD